MLPWRMALPESKWHNPFSVFKCGIISAAVAAFAKYLYESADLLAAIPELEGKVLGCWCKVKPSDQCHGDVLVKLVNAFATKPVDTGCVQYLRSVLSLQYHLN